MRKILITGCSGMLGRYVRRQIEAAGYEVIAPSREQMDLTNSDGVYAYIKAAAPDAILHLGAETDVDLCERNPARGGIVNHLATRAIARAARDIKAWLLYVSTASVFGLEPKPLFNELDATSPVNYYGRSKLFGEKEVNTILAENSLIVRASWMIGGGRKRDHKFVGKIVEKIEGGAELIRAVNDRYGTLTSAPMLAAFILSALKQRWCGLIHYASSGVVSRFDIAKEIAKSMRFKGSVEPASSSEFPSSAPRAVFEGIHSIYISISESTRAGFWCDDLSHYLNEFKTEI